VQMLLGKGADMQGTDCAALQVASACGHKEVVQALLDQGADVNAQDRFFGNSLQAACT
jgi:ankyrin repeat protein